MTHDEQDRCEAHRGKMACVKACTFSVFRGILGLVPLIAILYYLGRWTVNIDVLPAPIVVTQVVGVILGALWLSIGIWRGRILGLVQRAVYDPDKDWMKWKVVGIALRWSYKTESHGKIYEPWEGKNAPKRAEHVRDHYVYITMWEFRSRLHALLGGMSVCGIAFRAGNMVGDTPAGKQLLCTVGGDLDLFDRLWLRKELAEFSRLVGLRIENESLRAGDLERLMKTAVRNIHPKQPLYGSSIHHLQEVFLHGHYSPSLHVLADALKNQGMALIDGAIMKNNNEIFRLRADYMRQLPGRRT